MITTKGLVIIIILFIFIVILLLVIMGLVNRSRDLRSRMSEGRRKELIEWSQDLAERICGISVYGDGVDPSLVAYRLREIAEEMRKMDLEIIELNAVEGKE